MSWFWLGLIVLLLSAGCVSPSHSVAGDEPVPLPVTASVREWIGEFALSDVGRIQAAGRYANTGLQAPDDHNCVQITVRGLQLVSLVADASWTANPQEPSLIGYTFLKDEDGPFRNHNDTIGQTSLHLAIDYTGNESADWVTIGFHPAPAQPVSIGFTSDIQVLVALRYIGERELVAETKECSYDPNPLR
jgi:hypothetical protein